MVKIFISHSTKDFRLVNVLGNYIRSFGIDVYIAERDYQPGKSLSQKIFRNIDTSNYFLVVYTINGKDSHYVSEEIGYWNGKKGEGNNLIPFVEKGINPEASLCGVEYIEFDPLNPKLGMANVTNYVRQQIKLKKKEVIYDVGITLGFAGIISLIFYGLYKWGEK
ncbi:hypothetical protein LCGC14_1733100 [marine sediment metagenome]|uniref:TIR domain-containing protein n=1 Tax=marine sediment metagenome TaxID=412755 RepID=A0A0F9JPD0_9ZZZZ